MEQKLGSYTFIDSEQGQSRHGRNHDLPPLARRLGVVERILWASLVDNSYAVTTRLPAFRCGELSAMAQIVKDR